MKKFKITITLLLLLALSLTLFACNNPSSETESESFVSTVEASSLVTVLDDFVIIEVTSEYTPISNSTYLISYMNKLKTDGALEFEVKDGMITSIFNKANNSSSFWMIYSSDKELSNETWGSVTVEEKTYFSAILGAESLPIKDGAIYVLAYQTF